jgi:hypothetical protein
VENLLPRQVAPVLILFAAAAALAPLPAQPRRPFSHKYHLEQVSTCEACHTQATESAKAEDNLLPDTTECARCHDEVTIPQPRKVSVQKFNHAKHIKMGNVAPVILAAIKSGAFLAPPGDLPKHLTTKETCVACHHGIDQAETPGKAHYPQMAECLVCHNKVDPPQSCKHCHADSFQLKPGDHTREFADAHSTGKGRFENKGCAVCHGRNFRCQGCH